MAIRLVKLHKDTRGIAHLFLILLVVGVIGVGGFAYWRISSYSNKDKAEGRETTTDGTSNNTGAISEECIVQTGDENICRLGAISDLSQYSSEVTMTSEGATYVIKFDGKGNTDTSLGDAGRGISVGGKYYIYMMGKWYDSGNDASQAPQNPVPNVGFATTAGIKYENLGKEPCGNDTCLKYRMTGGILGEGTVVCWFGDKDFLPRRYESTGGGLLGSMTMTIDYKPITITAPEGALPISSLMSGAQ